MSSARAFHQTFNVDDDALITHNSRARVSAAMTTERSSMMIFSLSIFRLLHRVRVARRAAGGLLRIIQIMINDFRLSGNLCVSLAEAFFLCEVFEQLSKTSRFFLLCLLPPCHIIWMSSVKWQINANTMEIFEGGDGWPSPAHERFSRMFDIIKWSTMSLDETPENFSLKWALNRLFCFLERFSHSSRAGAFQEVSRSVEWVIELLTVTCVRSNNKTLFYMLAVASIFTNLIILKKLNSPKVIANWLEKPSTMQMKTFEIFMIYFPLHFSLHFVFFILCSLFSVLLEFFSFL